MLNAEPLDPDELVLALSLRQAVDAWRLTSTQSPPGLELLSILRFRIVRRVDIVL